MNSATAYKVLQTAAEFVGGEKQLALRLGIAQSLLRKLMAGRYPMPHFLFLQAVDIVLAHRAPLIPLTDTRTSELGGDSAMSQ